MYKRQVVIGGGTDLQTPLLSHRQGVTWRQSVSEMLNLDVSSSSSSSRSSSGGGDNGGGDGIDDHLTPNHALKVTILVRKVPPHVTTTTTATNYNNDINNNNDGGSGSIDGLGSGREILNLQALIDRLQLTGIVDEQWLNNHIVSFDGSTPFRKQVIIMMNTDIFITTHGAGLTNLLFLKPHSAVIEVFTAPWYENGYSATALSLGLYYTSIPHSRSNTCYCSDDVPQSCLNEMLYVNRSRLDCIALRSCSSTIDIDSLEVAFWIASQNVRILKRQLFSYRSINGSSDSGSSDSGNKKCISSNNQESKLLPINSYNTTTSNLHTTTTDICWYARGYKSLLMKTSDKIPTASYYTGKYIVIILYSVV